MAMAQIMRSVRDVATVKTAVIASVRMSKKVKCPSNLCGHREYTDDSDRTCTPQPLCPECAKLLLTPAPNDDGSGEDYEETY